MVARNIAAVVAVVAVVVAVGGGIWVPPIHPAQLVKNGRGGGGDMENIATIHLMEEEKRKDLGTGGCGAEHKTA